MDTGRGLTLVEETCTGATLTWTAGAQRMDMSISALARLEDLDAMAGLSDLDTVVRLEE